LSEFSTVPQPINHFFICQYNLLLINVIAAEKYEHCLELSDNNTRNLIAKRAEAVEEQKREGLWR
jgi:hypothetical protein